MISKSPRIKPDGINRVPKSRNEAAFPDLNFDRAPFIVIWEVTRACDLKCVHCRAEAITRRDSRELNGDEARTLIDQIREFGNPLFVITGGDPLKRPDLLDLVRYSAGVGLRVALTPSGTPLLSPKAIDGFLDAGASRLAVSLDGSTVELHDGFRQVPGTFDCTLRAIRHARSIGLPVQVNTSITRHNVHDLSQMARFLMELDICLWSVFLVVPTGRAGRSDLISARQHEEVFERLYEIQKTAPYDVKTTAGQHFRRVVIQKTIAETGAAPREMQTGAWSLALDTREAGLRHENGGNGSLDGVPAIGRAGKGVNDGNGVVFISHIGDVYPSGFLPLVVGNVRERTLPEIYRNNPIMRALRDSSRLKGKCGMCEFRDVCGGSRARAHAITGDMLGSEPYCTHLPAAWLEHRKSLRKAQ